MATNVATTAPPPKQTFTLNSLREAGVGGLKPVTNPFLFKKFAMHMKKDHLPKCMTISNQILIVNSIKKFFNKKSFLKYFHGFKIVGNCFYVLSRTRYVLPLFEPK
jgi:hypothetical protein